MATASGAMRLMRPVRTWPGPTSMKVVTPSARHRLDRADPVDAGGEVVDELRAAALGGRDDAGVGVGEERRVGVVEGDAGEDVAHARGRVGHERGVGGDARPAARWRASRRAPSRWRATPRPRRARRRRRPGPASSGSRRRTRRARRRAPTSSREPGVVEPDDARPSGPRARCPTPASAGRGCGPGGRRRARSRAPAATRAVYWPIEWPAAKAGSGMSTPSSVPALADGLEVGDATRRAARAGRSRCG